MCGRYTLRAPVEKIAHLLGIPAASLTAALKRPPRYNIAPTQPVPAALAPWRDKPRELRLLDVILMVVL